MLICLAGGSIPAVIGLNVAQGSATNAIEQYISTGKVDMNQVLQSGIMEGATAGLMPSGGSKGVNSITDSLDNNVDNAVSSTIKNADNNVNDAVSATIDSADNYLDEGADAANTVSKNVDTGPDSLTPLENGPYIKNGKPNGRPTLSGKEKLKFEQEVYAKDVSTDGILRDPNVDDVINWKPGSPRKDVVDFGHNSGSSYNEKFLMYKNREITLDDLKEFQFDPANYRLETPSSNRSRIFQ